MRSLKIRLRRKTADRGPVETGGIVRIVGQLAFDYCLRSEDFEAETVEELMAMVKEEAMYFLIEQLLEGRGEPVEYPAPVVLEYTDPVDATYNERYVLSQTVQLVPGTKYVHFKNTGEREVCEDQEYVGKIQD